MLLNLNKIFQEVPVWGFKKEATNLGNYTFVKNFKIF